MGNNILLQLEHVGICRNENVVLQDASFALDPGEFVYVIGKVGSGKSSLLKALYCEIPLQSGEGRLLGYDLTRIKRKIFLICAAN